MKSRKFACGTSITFRYQIPGRSENFELAPNFENRAFRKCGRFSSLNLNGRFWGLSQLVIQWSIPTIFIIIFLREIFLANSEIFPGVQLFSVNFNAWNSFLVFFWKRNWYFHCLALTTTQTVAPSTSLWEINRVTVWKACNPFYLKMSGFLNKNVLLLKIIIYPQPRVTNRAPKTIVGKTLMGRHTPCYTHWTWFTWWFHSSFGWKWLPDNKQDPYVILQIPVCSVCISKRYQTT